MILESLVTTQTPTGTLHVAPMGPRQLSNNQWLLRPFPSSNTFRHLQQHGQGVIHITDNVLLFAKAAVGEAGIPAHRPAEKVQGYILEDACRFLEFQVQSIDTTSERVHIQVEIVHEGTQRDFFGFNRGKHAVLELAIQMTRLHLMPLETILADIERYRTWVDKTGGEQERAAFHFLTEWLDQQSCSVRK